MPADAPLVSVIVPCHNAARWLPETLASVARQELPGLELIVVDDGSTDGSAAVAQAAYAEVRVLQTGGVGASGARQAGADAARGEFVQFLDADDLLAPGKLRRQLDALEASGADAAYGAWEKLVEARGGYRPGEVVERELPQDAEVALFTDFWAPPAVWLFRAALVRRVRWRDDLPVIQDARYALDCALAGARFVRVPGVVASYRVHVGGSLSTRDPRAFVRDCLHNALQVENVWRERNALGESRRQALVQVYAHIARGTYGADSETFDAAWTALRRLVPDYLPAEPRLLALAARVVGYPRAEALAFLYRRARRLLSPVASSR